MTDLDSDVHLEILENRNINENEKVLCVTSEPSWMDPIINSLKLRELSDEPAMAHKVKCQASHYILIEKKIV